MISPLKPLRPLRQVFTGSTAARSVLLFINFFLILLAYYLVKPASRSLFLEHSSADMLPWVWTASGLLLLTLVPGYQRLLRRFGRMRVVLGVCVGTAALLFLFYGLFRNAGLAVALGFYVLVDIFSVVLVEQFWSLTNSVYDSREGKRWYGLIASGGLVGAASGGLTASWLLQNTPLQTDDLIAVAGVLVLAMGLLTWKLARAGVYREREGAPARSEHLDFSKVWSSIKSSRLIALIAVLLLFSQICEPVIEYEFMHHVEANYTERDARTVFLSNFLSVLNGVALSVNLLVTPLLHRYAGVIAGLLVQPLLLGVSALVYAVQVDLRSAAAMKIADRSLSYSINRASRELLYVGADGLTIFRVKAWIDMVGYRVFKIAGNVGILLLGQLLPWQDTQHLLAAVVVALCLGWGVAVFALLRLDATPKPPSDSGRVSPAARPMAL